MSGLIDTVGQVARLTLKYQTWVKVSNSDRNNSFSRAKMPFYCLRSIVTVMGTISMFQQLFLRCLGIFCSNNCFLENFVVITFVRTKVCQNTSLLEHKFVRTQVCQNTSLLEHKFVTTKVFSTKVCYNKYFLKQVCQDKSLL